MSIISQSTQDSSGSRSLDSEPRCSLRSRCYDSLESVQQRLDYVKSTQITRDSINEEFLNISPQIINNTINNNEQEQNKTNYIMIGSGIVIAVLISLLVVQMYSSPQCTQISQPMPHKYSLEKLLDPIQVRYIKSYEESAVGKYFYWDLLAEEYFKMIVEKLKKVVWMEEEFIELFFDKEFSQRDSKIIKQKLRGQTFFSYTFILFKQWKQNEYQSNSNVWKLRDKSTDIEVETNMADKIIWRYKNCFCL